MSASLSYIELEMARCPMPPKSGANMHGDICRHRLQRVVRGHSLIGGEATMRVVATGAATRFGGIAASLRAKVPPTSFERGMHALGMLICG